MFDAHLNAQRTLSYYVHGPEWAFVIPYGDFDALRDVVEICSRSWNGVGSLILVSDDAGRLRGNWRSLVQTRPLDTTWLHPSLTEAARDVLRANDALRAQEWASGFGFNAEHPARLIDPAPGVEMVEPVFATPALQRVATVVWGTIDDAGTWSSRFDVGTADTDVAFLALLAGQLGINMVSPLRMGQVAMRVFGQYGTSQPFPYLWIFDGGSFEELVGFWNLRSGADAGNGIASVIGLPREALRATVPLTALTHWAGSTRRWLQPAFLARVAARLVPELESVLAGMGIARDPEPKLRTQADAGERTLTWLPWKTVFNGPIARGAWDDVMYSIATGSGVVRLERPRGYRPRGGAPIVLQNLPFPLPVTKSAAKRAGVGFYAHARGLGVTMGSASPWLLHVQVPDEAAALSDWAADHGYTVGEPRPAADARAVLTRLGSPDGLDALADPVAIDVLNALAPLSRDRLVRRLAREFTTSGDRDRLAEELAEAIRHEGLLLEVAARTVEQLDSALPGHQRTALIAALDHLVGAGFVGRGREVTCPTCRFVAFLELRELAEHVRCRACGGTFLLPVTGAGDVEAPTAYRIDGLMARVMDQHVLPVLLALRALRIGHQTHLPTHHFWPGVLFDREGDREFDVDLVASDGTGVFVAECKLDARGLKLPQLRKLLALADTTGATPVVAALAGDFSPAVRRELRPRDGIVLDREDLLS